MEVRWLKEDVSARAFLEIASAFADEPGTCLLYSGGEYVTAEHSYLSLFPEEVLRPKGANPWEQLEKGLVLSSQPIPEWFGFLGYELGKWNYPGKNLGLRAAAIPDFYFQKSGCLLVYNHLKQTLTCFGKWREINQISSFKTGSWRLAQPMESAGLFQEKVKAAQEYILKGDVYQVNVSQQLVFEGTSHPFGIFLKMAEINPAPFMAYIKQDDFSIVSTSPERFLCKKGKRLETRPIKGTAPRGKNVEEDEYFKRKLQQSPKEAAELLMITDLMRNDLGRVSLPGSVRTLQRSLLDAYANVYHQSSLIVSQSAEINFLQIIRKCFPGGSVTGCPKLRALEVIDKLESYARGLYTGSIGYLTGNGDFDLNIAIRTMVFHRGLMQVSLGSGIVADSDPREEYLETLHKGASLFKSIDFIVS